jgi:tetratricopeptide (TPR) repeat protein
MVETKTTTNLKLCCKMLAMIRILLALLFMAGALWGQTPAGAKSDASDSTNGANKPAVASTTPTPLAAARLLLQTRQYAEAATAFRAIVDKYPAAEEAQVGLMRSLVHTTRVDDAEEAGKKALAALPNSAVIHAAFGDVEFRAGKLGEAEKEYRAALKLDGNSARAWFGMGRMYDTVFLRKRAQGAFAGHAFLRGAAASSQEARGRASNRAGRGQNQNPERSGTEETVHTGWRSEAFGDQAADLWPRTGRYGTLRQRIRSKIRR